jgi:hypothetical protein
VNDSSGITGKLERAEDEQTAHLSLALDLSRYVAHHLHESHRTKMDGTSTALAICP